MNRRYPERPMVGVGAIIVRDEGEVLLVRRGREPALGKWSVPGGLVEVGETLHDALLREVREESGLQVLVKGLVAVLDRIIHDDTSRVEYHYVILDFLCEYVEGVPHPGTDVTECAFVPYTRLGDYPLTTGTQEVIRRAMELAGSPSLSIYDKRL